MPTFQEMFRDYDKELADVERNRVDQVQAAEREGEAERQGMQEQLSTAQGDRAMWIQWNYDNSLGEEANKIRGINDRADKDKQAIEDDRKTNEQQRVEATGLKLETGPAPDQGAPANVNAFGVVPPDPPAAPPQEPPKEAAAQAAEQSQESSTFMRDLVSGGKGAVGDVMFNLAAIGVALITQVQSILQTADHENALAALNQEKATATRDGSDIKPDSMVVNPPVEEGELDEKSTATYEQQEHQEEQAGMQSAINAEKNTPELVQNPPEERVVTQVFGVELKAPPPPPPPPPANDNRPLTKG